jgi:hypothetical protein
VNGVVGVHARLVKSLLVDGGQLTAS